ncbi:hypothetical protein ACLIR7_08960 [Nitratireductor aquimarinus]|uniref:hypothetical protein n=1 Tax=Nitratireductor aquimarinus TaxID=889300 RepID=UPI00398E92E8
MTGTPVAIGREQTRFGQADRDRIRRCLLRYMEDNRIGVPTLQKLIAEANDLSLDRLPLKTLQRFLADTHRSNDILVRFCQRFAADLADDDPLDSFGEALIGFWAAPASVRNWQALAPDMIGAFEGQAEEAVTGLRMGQDSWVPFSTLTVEAVPAQPYARAAETISNWGRTASSSSGDPVRRSYEGVLLHPPGALLLALRNSLTGAPRLYWLDAFDGPRLTGYGHESATSIEDRQVSAAAFNAARVIFDRVGSEAKT